MNDFIDPKALYSSLEIYSPYDCDTFPYNNQNTQVQQHYYQQYVLPESHLDPASYASTDSIPSIRSDSVYASPSVEPNTTSKAVEVPCPLSSLSCSFSDSYGAISSPEVLSPPAREPNSSSTPNFMLLPAELTSLAQPRQPHMNASRNSSVSSAVSSTTSQSSSASPASTRSRSTSKRSSRLTQKSAKCSIAASAGGFPVQATVPTVIQRDSTGVDWISFTYSKDRVKTPYTIRCDIETVDISSTPSSPTSDTNVDGASGADAAGAAKPMLSDDFKKQNCIYPRACVPPDQYKGNRQKYETECNCIGWCLAYINPEIRGQRGLIQRAVDSWRNTNANLSLRSRRVRRMGRRNEKIKTEAAAAAAAAAVQYAMPPMTSYSVLQTPPHPQQQHQQHQHQEQQTQLALTYSGHPLQHIPSPSPSPTLNSTMGYYNDSLNGHHLSGNTGKEYGYLPALTGGYAMLNGYSM